MESKNHILNKSFKDLDDYINKLERYALIGMMGEVLSHGFNSGLSTLNIQINNLPDEYDKIKKNYSHTIGLVNGLMKQSYDSLYRNNIDAKDFKKYFENSPYTIEISEEASFFVNKNVFMAVLFELTQNAVSNVNKASRNLKDVSIIIRKNIIQIKSVGLPPNNPDRIFNLGYTERIGTGGRGFGLYISKRILSEMGYDLRYNYLGGNTNLFSIVKKK